MNPTHSTHPRVSVVLRTRDRPNLLERAIRDVLDQSFDALELVIVDEADAVEPVANVVAALAAHERARVNVVSRAGLEHGRWLAANAGVEASRGQYIVLHDDDDLWDSEFLSTAVGFLDEHPDIAAACVRTEVIIERPDDAGRLVRTDSYPFLPELNDITLADMLRANRIPPISLLYRRKLHNELGSYDESLKVLGDWEFYVRILSHHPVRLIDKKLAFWSHRPEDEGHEANSISLGRIRQTTDARIRDAIVRAGAAERGLSPYLHIAGEMNWLRAEVAEEFRDADSRMRASAAATEARLGARLDRLQASIDALQATLYERTSLSHRIRKAVLRKRT